MKINFLFISKIYIHFFEDVDLADLVTLIDWQSKVDIEIVRDALGKEISSLLKLRHDPESQAAFASFEEGIPIHYYAVEGSLRPPKKRNQNLVVGSYYEYLPNERKFLSAHVVVNTTNLSFAKPPPHIVPTRLPENMIEEDIEIGDPVLLKNTEHLNLPSGVYYKGVKVK